MSNQPLPPFFRLFLKVEEIILTRLVPLKKPGPLFKWIFKAPILHYKLGLGWMVGKYFLLLTTIGRKSGKPRHTPLEYRYDPADDSYFIMAGWGGNTDWFRNVTANPNVSVQVGRRKFTCRAERVSDEDVAEKLAETIRLNPGSIVLWSRWAGEEVDGSPESLLRAAKHFPSFWLKPM